MKPSLLRTGLLLSSAFAACQPVGPPSPSAPPPTPCAPPVPTPGTAVTPATVDHWLVLDSVDLTDNEDTLWVNGSPGFDLDGHFSGTHYGASNSNCSRVDFFSTLDLDQNCAVPDASERCARPGACIRYDATNIEQSGGHGGVDNSLPLVFLQLELLSRTADLPAACADRVRSGPFVLLGRLSGVAFDTAGVPLDSDAATLRLYLGAVAPGSSCEQSAARVLRVRRDALLPGQSDLDAARSVLRGAVQSRRLRVAAEGPVDLTGLLPPLRGLVFPAVLSRVQLRADLTLRSDGVYAERGNFGGALDLHGVLAQLEAAFPGGESLLENSIAVTVDLATSVCVQRQGNRVTDFGLTSAGLGFTLRPAQVDTQTLAEGPDTRCDTSPDAGVAADASPRG